MLWFFLARRRYKPLYKRQPSIIIVVVFKNGSRDVFCKLAAPNIKIVSYQTQSCDVILLLEAEKLALKIILYSWYSFSTGYRVAGK